MFLKNCVITELSDKSGLVQITGVCPICENVWHLTLTENSVENFVKDQNTLPDLVSRGLLIDGICNDCTKTSTKTSDDI
jgi:hypothetical protein